MANIRREDPQEGKPSYIDAHLNISLSDQFDCNCCLPTYLSQKKPLKRNATKIDLSSVSHPVAEPDSSYTRSKNVDTQLDSKTNHE